MKKEIKSALEHAQKQVARLLADRQEIDKQIIRWKRVVDSLAVVSEDVETSIPADLELPAGLSEKPGIGFTDAIRVIIANSKIGLTPTEVRDELRRIGFDLRKYKQEMVPVHNTLKRLEEQGEIYSVETQPDFTVYRRVDPVARALALDPPPKSELYGKMMQLRDLMGPPRTEGVTYRRYDPKDPDHPLNKSGMRGMNK